MAAYAAYVTLEQLLDNLPDRLAGHSVDLEPYKVLELAVLHALNIKILGRMAGGGWRGGQTPHLAPQE
eukprot:scaffold103728_cov18-Tisochrysis_lutea.AAC.1